MENISVCASKISQKNLGILKISQIEKHKLHLCSPVCTTPVMYLTCVYNTWVADHPVRQTEADEERTRQTEEISRGRQVTVVQV